ncbi:hypothetical protein JTE90_027348 [Oedothorax gibbosus]|uniref:Uncharacterized protein n=1 Tax=Oedothorax gibbosus TaxID=931172 RepID=A0AAV6VYT8_9ARAC|nr:hypothetical protein JTE90_027348 [Oedothorax gibbosus]
MGSTPICNLSGLNTRPTVYHTFPGDQRKEMAGGKYPLFNIVLVVFSCPGQNPASSVIPVFMAEWLAFVLVCLHGRDMR